MYSLALLAFIAFALSLLATGLCCRVALKLGFVDQPDHKRKIHTMPIPRVGGIAIAAAYVGAYVLALPFHLTSISLVAARLTCVWSLLPIVLIVFLTGLIDDIRSLRPWHKLVGEVLAGSLAWAVGVRIPTIAGWELPLWASFAITVVWLVGCANALNLIDGLDGLAAGVGLVASATTFVMALLSGDQLLAIATAPLIGALFGFLKYNFHPAKIFLGDCGSLTIGFLLGCYAVLWSQKSATLLGMAAPAIALAVPILDTSLSVARRLLRGRPLFGADRGHIHHRLLDRGLTPRRASLVLYGVCVVAACLSLAQNALHASYAGLGIVAFCALAAVGISQLRYAEFRIARRIVLKRTFRRKVDAHVQLADLEVALAHARDLEECWPPLRDTCRSLGFDEIRLCAGDVHYRELFRHRERDAWVVRIPLTPHEDYLQLTHEFTAERPVALGTLAETVRSSLRPKLEALHETAPALRRLAGSA